MSPWTRREPACGVDQPTLDDGELRRGQTLTHPLFEQGDEGLGRVETASAFLGGVELEDPTMGRMRLTPGEPIALLRAGEVALPQPAFHRGVESVDRLSQEVADPTFLAAVVLAELYWPCHDCDVSKPFS